jgi:hypothetical protein
MREWDVRERASTFDDHFDCPDPHPKVYIHVSFME